MRGYFPIPQNLKTTDCNEQTNKTEYTDWMWRMSAMDDALSLRHQEDLITLSVTAHTTTKDLQAG